MAVTAFFDMIDALVDLIGSDGEEIQLADLTYTVFDGPPTSESYPPNVVIIGWDGDPDGEWQTAVLDQSWAAIGRKLRDEVIEIPCCLLIEYGDGDAWKTCRDRAEKVLTDVETKLRNAPDLGLAVDGVRQVIVAEFKPVAMYQTSSSEMGSEFRLEFAVRIQTRT